MKLLKEEAIKLLNSLGVETTEDNIQKTCKVLAGFVVCGAMDSKLVDECSRLA